MTHLDDYYTDITDETGQIVASKRFNKRVYIPKFNINSYSNYRSRDYYEWINKNLNVYSFPANYQQKTFQELCENRDYSLKPQQKFAGRIFNTLVENRGMLVYHGLGSGKTQTSIVIAEAFSPTFISHFEQKTPW